MKLASLNIEGDNNLNFIIPFLQKEKPDVICLQEVFEADLPIFQKTLHMEGMFVPTVIVESPLRARLQPKGKLGIAMLAHQHSMKWRSAYYYIVKKTKDVIPAVTTVRGNIGHKALLIGEGIYKGRKYKIITTHFSWSHNGRVTQRQQKQMKNLLRLLEQEKEFVICGDFNTPRGKELWTQLASRYTDNIPQHITTTIDNTIHQDAQRGKGIYLVVDGFFSTSRYKVSNVRVIDGVSDHCAVVGEVFVN